MLLDNRVDSLSPKSPILKPMSQEEVTQKAKEESEYTRYWFPRKESTARSPTVCTHDLIGWAFQIACGMNYLTKRKVTCYQAYSLIRLMQLI